MIEKLTTEQKLVRDSATKWEKDQLIAKLKAQLRSATVTLESLMSHFNAGEAVTPGSIAAKQVRDTLAGLQPSVKPEEHLNR